MVVALTRDRRIRAALILPPVQCGTIMRLNKETNRETGTYLAEERFQEH
jgi:hypothetical protein